MKRSVKFGVGSSRDEYLTFFLEHKGLLQAPWVDYIFTFISDNKLERIKLISEYKEHCLADSNNKLIHYADCFESHSVVDFLFDKEIVRNALETNNQELIDKILKRKMVNKVSHF